MKAKEWLKANGHVKEVTRGRISTANHALLAQAVADGVKLSDYAPKEVIGTKGETRVKNVSPIAATGEKVIRELLITYPEDSFKAVQLDGKERGMREVCHTCHVSLVGHVCAEPAIVALDASGDVRVNIVRR